MGLVGYIPHERSDSAKSGDCIRRFWTHPATGGIEKYTFYPLRHLFLHWRYTFLDKFELFLFYFHIFFISSVGKIVRYFLPLLCQKDSNRMLQFRDKARSFPLWAIDLGEPFGQDVISNLTDWSFRRDFCYLPSPMGRSTPWRWELIKWKSFSWASHLYLRCSENRNRPTTFSPVWNNLPSFRPILKPFFFLMS